MRVLTEPERIGIEVDHAEFMRLSLPLAVFGTLVAENPSRDSIMLGEVLLLTVFAAVCEAAEPSALEEYRDSWEDHLDFGGMEVAADAVRIWLTKH